MSDKKYPLCSPTLQQTNSDYVPDGYTLSDPGEWIGSTVRFEVQDGKNTTGPGDDNFFLAQIRSTFENDFPEKNSIYLTQNAGCRPCLPCRNSQEVVDTNANNKKEKKRSESAKNKRKDLDR